MRTTIKLACAIIAFGMALCSVYSAEDGWIELFDGKTLKGWIQRGGKAKYTVVDGVIVGETVTNTPNSFLCTEQEYGDFILELEFKVDQKLNSGVQIRSQCFDKPTVVQWQGKEIKIPANRVHGYQIEIDPSSRAWTGGIYDEGRRGWLFDLKNKPDAQKAFKQNEWNKIRVEAKGDSIKTWINGVEAADLKDSMTLKGIIALQVHSAKDGGLKVQFRNIRLKKLD
ncbi:MAG: DUF1080 domain-containing protein [Verrucomicrobiae bacterium]|nr:DUF1080 domain-containing protein [Verrucomicrobiae bacterium]